MRYSGESSAGNRPLFIALISLLVILCASPTFCAPPTAHSQEVTDVPECTGDGGLTLTFHVSETEKKFRCPTGWELEPGAATAAFQGKASEVELETILNGAKLEKVKEAYTLSLPSGPVRNPRTWYYVCKEMGATGHLPEDENSSSQSESSQAGSSTGGAEVGGSDSEGPSRHESEISPPGGNTGVGGQVSSQKDEPHTGAGSQSLPAGPAQGSGGSTGDSNSAADKVESDQTSDVPKGPNGVDVPSGGLGSEPDGAGKKQSSNTRHGDTPDASSIISSRGVLQGPASQEERDTELETDDLGQGHEEENRNEQEETETSPASVRPSSAAALAEIGAKAAKTALRASRAAAEPSAEQALKTCKVTVQVLPSSVIECAAGETKTAAVSAVGTPAVFSCGNGLALDLAASMEKVYDDEDGKCASQATLKDLVDGTLSSSPLTAVAEENSKAYILSVDALPDKERHLCYKCVPTSNGEEAAKSTTQEEQPKACMLKVSVTSMASSSSSWVDVSAGAFVGAFLCGLASTA
ncbi:hypothetical protein BESB_081970 [Besnoitia besnoiti]|uniref:SRS domain-containing protein n=1 Tax=Besnoitia besnoiti TaxID=94643 RepID=A0A2A9M3D3_BESBE|nr:hypothetical protein BESB_081970 [Besnoitia besnoiti]PFH32998.1 hypothetical protein BESB_081970 [Besnoitia besnoiti]